MSNPNVELVRKIFEEMLAGNFQLYLESVTDDLSYTAIGSTAVSGTVRGREENFARYTRMLAALEGPIKLTPDNIFGEGEFVALQGHGQARTKTGQAYNNTYCLVFRFREGKIAEVTEYLDTELVRAAFG